jgi:hypothetical protein
VRTATAVSFWLMFTSALLVAVPVNWAQHTIVDADGYAELARSAGHKPGVREATAAVLAERVGAVARDRGFDGGDGVIRQVASAYTSGPSFPDQFADVNRVAHQWLFTDNARQTGQGWQIDIAPMLADTSFKASLTQLGVQVPDTITVPVISNAPNNLKPGLLRPMATWGPWVGIGAAVWAALTALLTLVLAKSRGKALAGLGVSALLVGGIGWAGLAIVRGRVDQALAKTNGNVHAIADALVAQAEDSLQQWLTYTLIAGGVLAVAGVLVTVLGASMRRKKPAVSYAPMQPQGYPPTRPPMPPTQPPSI